MPGQIRQFRLSGLFKDKAMHAELEKVRTEREEARTVVRGVLAGGSTFRALQKACRNLREVMQTVENRYLNMYACELEDFTKAGDMKGWYGHLKCGWKLQGKKVGSAQYIRDEDGKLLWKLEKIRARWRRYFAFLLNTTSAALDRTITKGILPKPVAPSLGNPPVVNETKQARSSMANGKAMVPDELPMKLLKFGLPDSTTKSCTHSTASSWLCG